MPLKKRRLNRDEFDRDARVIVIASEDTYAVEQYFRRFRARRVIFKVLPTEDGQSAPESVLARLDKFKREEATEEGDELWLCIDTDHWTTGRHLKNFTIVLQLCRQKGYKVAISNPCFELWLLLHYCDASSNYGCCNDVRKQLSEAVGGYTKSTCDRLEIRVDQVENALRRGRLLDSKPDDLIPSSPVSRVYQLVEILKQYGYIELK